jgi:cytochrome c-type biogenesis protein CcmH/NrfF
VSAIPKRSFTTEVYRGRNDKHEFPSVFLCVLCGSLLFVIFGLPLRTPAGAHATEPVSFQDIEESLTCQCGCGLTVHSCNHLQCGSAIPLREEIRAQMAQGKDKQAILAYFSEKYGEKILSSPTTVGFNIVAWIMPFALVALGGIIIGVALLRWNTRTRPPAHGDRAAPPQAAAAHVKLMEKELKGFDG